MATIIGKEFLPEGEELNGVLSVVEEHGFQNYTITIEQGSKVGDNYMGVILSITVQENNKKLNLILKFSKRSEIKDTIMDKNCVYSCEIYSYTKYLPNLYEYQNKYKIKNGLSPVAKVYRTSRIDSDEYLIMENMKAKGFLMRSKQSTMDFNHCELVFTQLGYLHGLGYVWKTNEYQKYLKITECYKSFNVFDSFNDEQLRIYVRNMTEMACKLFDPETENVAYNKVKNFMDLGLDEYIINYNSSDVANDKYSVLIHGDCWNNNILFKYDGNKPIELCFLDWQISRVVSPALELSYFMYSTVDTELCSSHFDDFINIYYNALSDVIRRCNLNPEDIFPFSVLQEHIKKYFVFGIQFAIHLIPMILLDGEDVGEFTNLQDIINDGNSPFSKIVENKVYQERLRGVIFNGIERGLI